MAALYGPPVSRLCLKDEAVDFRILLILKQVPLTHAVCCCHMEALLLASRSRPGTPNWHSLEPAVHVESNPWARRVIDKVDGYQFKPGQ